MRKPTRRDLRAILVAVAAAASGTALVTAPALAANYTYIWPGYPDDGVQGNYTITNGIVGTGPAACNEMSTYISNGHVISDAFSNETASEFHNGTAVEVWCNVYVSDPTSSAWCYPRFQVWNNNVKQGWWGQTPAPICTQYTA